ncbi:MAG: leucine-rich repeat protein [Clostridia bacterium]|nr:leucine-rich repeat protein [Clostridia bacterium]
MNSTLWKKLSGVLFAAVLAVALFLPAPTKAEAASYSGSCGTNVNWSLDTETGVLSITGTGAMYNQRGSLFLPWSSQSSFVKTISIGSGVTHIGNFVFCGLTCLTNATIPDSVTSIGDDAFNGCTGLTGIIIPDSVASIGNYAFSGCTGLTSITIPDSVTSIGSSAFSGCTGLTQVTIGNGVASIGNYAFSGCKGLTSITIPDGVTSIGDHAFYYCTGLTSITIPDNVTSIEYWAFFGCTGLTSVTIPDSVTSIGNDAFAGCTGLTGITIPDSVTSIGNNAFNNCSNLKTVYYPGTPDQKRAISIGSYNDPISWAKWIYLIDELVVTPPQKTDYLTVDRYDSYGLSVRGKYDDGDPFDLSYNDYTISSPDLSTPGKKTVTVTYPTPDPEKPVTASFEINVRQVTGVAITTLPEKRQYEVREGLNTAGLVLTLTYHDGAKEEITSGFSTSGFSSSAAGEKTVTVSYAGLSDSFTVTVVKRLSGIGFYSTPAKTEYEVGERLDLSGMRLKRNYNDGSSDELTEGYAVSGFDSTKAGSKTVTVSYEGKTATFTVTVNKRLAGIGINTPPDKTEYAPGDAFDQTGLAVDLIYNDFSVSVVDFGFTLTGFDSETVGRKTIRVSYAGFTATFEVTVHGPAVPGDADGDGAVGAEDLATLLQYLAGMDFETGRSSVWTAQGADVTGDGKVDTADLIRMQNYLADPEHVELTQVVSGSEDGAAATEEPSPLQSYFEQNVLAKFVPCLPQARRDEL